MQSRACWERFIFIPCIPGSKCQDDGGRRSEVRGQKAEVGDQCLPSGSESGNQLLERTMEVKAKGKECERMPIRLLGQILYCRKNYLTRAFSSRVARSKSVKRSLV